jgi:uncharacterized protein (TIGR02271 family)
MVDRAENAVRALLDAGFSDDDIGVYVHDSTKGGRLADDLGREYASGTVPPSDVVADRATVYDRLGDRFKDIIVRAPMPDEAIGWYDNHLDRGDILVTVVAGDRMDDAKRIIQDHDGVLYHHEEPMREARPVTETRTTAEELHVPVIDEEVVVEKETRKVGEVVVTSQTSQETVDIPTTVTHEEIRVERRKLDRPLTPDEYKGATTKEGQIRMPIVEEEVHVMKNPVIREELIITRVPVSERKTFHETVMHTEPGVEATGDVEVEGLTEEERKRRRRPAA